MTLRRGQRGVSVVVSDTDYSWLVAQAATHGVSVKAYVQRLVTDHTRILRVMDEASAVLSPLSSPRQREVVS